MLWTNFDHQWAGADSVSTVSKMGWGGLHALTGGGGGGGGSWSSHIAFNTLNNQLSERNSNCYKKYTNCVCWGILI